MKRTTPIEFMHEFFSLADLASYLDLPFAYLKKEVQSGALCAFEGVSRKDIRIHRPDFLDWMRTRKEQRRRQYLTDLEHLVELGTEARVQQASLLDATREAMLDMNESIENLLGKARPTVFGYRKMTLRSLNGLAERKNAHVYPRVEETQTLLCPLVEVKAEEHKGLPRVVAEAFFQAIGEDNKRYRLYSCSNCGYSWAHPVQEVPRGGLAPRGETADPYEDALDLMSRMSDSELVYRALIQFRVLDNAKTRKGWETAIFLSGADYLKDDRIVWLLKTAIPFLDEKEKARYTSLVLQGPSTSRIEPENPSALLSRMPDGEVAYRAVVQFGCTRTPHTRVQFEQWILNYKGGNDIGDALKHSLVGIPDKLAEYEKYVIKTNPLNHCQGCGLFPEQESSVHYRPYFKKILCNDCARIAALNAPKVLHCQGCGIGQAARPSVQFRPEFQKTYCDPCLSAVKAELAQKTSEKPGAAASPQVPDNSRIKMTTSRSVEIPACETCGAKASENASVGKRLEGHTHCYACYAKFKQQQMAASPV